MKTFVLRHEENARALWAFLKNNWRACADNGKPLSVTIAGHKSKRSKEQNRKLWAMLNQISESVWIGGRQFSADAWHEHYKRKFIGSEETPEGGTVGISTTNLDVAEFSEYIEKIMVDASAEYGVELL